MRLTASARRTTGVVIAVATLAAAAGAAVASSPAAAAIRTVEVECANKTQIYRVEPSSCLMFEHGHVEYMTLRHARWSRWGAGRARGVAIGHLDRSRRPDLTGRVRIRLSRIVHAGPDDCRPGTYYTLAEFTFTSGPAKGRRFRMNMAAGCPA